MKKTAAALLMLVTLNVFSADISIKADNNDIIIRVNTMTENENIKIYNEKGEVLFSERINSKNYLKVFALDEVSKGQYFVEYENGSEINTAIVEKDANGIVVTSNFKKITFKPIIKQDGNYTSVGFTNPNRLNVNITITDENGFELVDIQNMNGLFIKKTFDTIRLPKGEYTVMVKTTQNTFAKNISIK